MCYLTDKIKNNFNLLYEIAVMDIKMKKLFNNIIIII